MPNKGISVPEDVVPIIEGLEVPFSRWVTEQLRLHAARTTPSFAEQLIRDAELAATPPPRAEERVAIGHRMERSAPW